MQREGQLNGMIAELQELAQTTKHQTAAQLALAGVYKHLGQSQQSEQIYQEVLKQAPNNITVLRALGERALRLGETATAQDFLTRALSHTPAGSDADTLRRQLLTLSLEQADISTARKHHERLVRAAKGSAFVRGELGRELAARGMHEEAVKERTRVVRSVAGDPRALARALKDLAQSQLALGQTEAALGTIDRALRLGRVESGLLNELLALKVEGYRNSGKVEELIRTLQVAPQSARQKRIVLGKLLEENGRQGEALDVYDALLRRRPNAEVRRRKLRILELQGKLKEAERELRLLVRNSPQDHRVVLELAQALLQQGKSAEAMAELASLERKVRGDKTALVRLVEFYEGHGEPKKALDLLERIGKRKDAEEQILTELGSRHFQAGRVKQAHATWKRILERASSPPQKARAAQQLGELYLQHGLTKMALEMLEKAVGLAPKQTRYRRALAGALESIAVDAKGTDKAQYTRRAREHWEALLKEEAHPSRTREARRHIVNLWQIDGTLMRRVAPLHKEFTATGNLETGRLLAALLIRLHQYPAATALLTTILKQAPGDVASALQLEQTLVAQRKLPEAIELLKRLARLQPQQARLLYQRMSQYASELYEDDQALAFAKEALKLSPNDADAHRKLGLLHRRQNAPQEAARELRTAIRIERQLYPVYFDLIELLLEQQQVEEAKSLTLQVLRNAQEDSVLERAGHVALQLFRTQNERLTLERTTLPLALARPHKSTYRHLLLNLYETLLPTRAPSAVGESRPETRENGQLARRALKPLLDCLLHSPPPMQRSAIDILSRIKHSGASATLLSFATGSGDPELRARAILAAGAARSESLVDRLVTYLSPQGELRVDEADPVSIGAAWSVVRLNSKPARRLQARLIRSDAPTAVALSALAYGESGNADNVPLLLELAASPTLDDTVRATTILALGKLGSRNESLVQFLASDNPKLRSAAMVALSWLSRNGSAPPPKALLEAIADAAWTRHPLLRNAVLASFAILSGKQTTQLQLLPSAPRRITREGLIQEALASVANTALLSSESTSALLERLVPLLGASATIRISSDPEGTVEVVRTLEGASEATGLGALLTHLGEVQAQPLLAALRRRLVSPLNALTAHRSATVRRAALGFLALRDEPAAVKALRYTLQHGRTGEQTLVLRGFAQKAQPPLLGDVLSCLEHHHDWSVRQLAAESLGLAWVQMDKPSRARATGLAEVLRRSALSDPYAWVRQSATLALAQIRPAQARATLKRVAAADAEPLVRATAAAALKSLNTEVEPNN